MAGSEDIKDTLEHVRLIHFSVLAVLGVLAYIVYQSWVDAPGLLRELADVGALASQLRESNPNTLRVEFHAEVSHARDALQAALASTRVRSFGIDSNYRSDLFGRASGWDYAPDDRLRKLFHSLKNAHWQLLRVVRIRSDTSQIEEWATDAFGQPEVFALDTEPTSGIGPAQLTLAKWLRIAPLAAPPLKHNTGPHLPKSPDQVQLFNTFEIEVEKRAETLSLDPSWLKKRFPLLAGERVALEDESIATAQERIKQAAQDVFIGEKQVIIGLEVKAQHLVVAGPLLLALIMVYLIAYLTELRKVLASSTIVVPQTRSWVGVISNWWAVVLTWVSLVLAPSVAVGITMRSSFWVTCPVTVFVFLLGFVAAYLATGIRKQFDRIAEGRLS